MPFRDIIISFASSGETAIKRTISVHLIDDYSYPITKSSNGAAAIGHPTDHPPITYKIGAQRTNHNRAFCHRNDYI